MTTHQSLTGLHILVTRPEGLADALCEEIIRLGGKTTHFPVIQIDEPDDTESRQHIVDTIGNYDIAIFISPTAVTKTSEQIPLSMLNLSVAGIGDATCSVLEKNNVSVGIIPQGNDSESLLQHPDLQSSKIRNKKIVIFKGEGGRNLLSDTLKSRGAEVFNAIMYRRIMPTNHVPLPRAVLETIDYILVSSGEGLTNLTNMVEDKNALLRHHVLVPGERCALLATQLGFQSIIKTANATNSACINALLALT